MNGIDTAIASVLSSRVDSLLGIAPGSAATSQTGAASVDTAPGAAPPGAAPAPQPSAQTALSAVALTLNAIASSGGAATLAVLGQAPLWPAAPALDVAAQSLPLSDATDAAGAAANANPNAAASASGPAASLSVAAAQIPVAALAAALERTVGESGLFYEAHLAAWLLGQRSPAGLAGEAQNRLVAAAQLPRDWTGADGEAAAQGASARPGSPGATPDGMPGGVQRGMQGGAQTGASSGASNGAPNATSDSSAAHVAPSILTAQAARLAAGEVLASSLSDLNGQSAHAGLRGAASQADAGAAQNAQSMAAAVHPATVPLVRQQLDLLATGQFRWTGEAWPGARLDWTIEQDGDEWDRSGGGLASEDDQPWRTRLTLSLPTLGTVDAELTLTGMRLTARVQASPHGAARLAMQGDSFRERLAAAGIELQSLTIREIGGGAPGTVASAAGATGAQVASVYARSATAAKASAASSGAVMVADPVNVAARSVADSAAHPVAHPVVHGPATARNTPAAARDDFDWDLS
ncbi:flagellar hook-length control protein FliK [Paraburkholderia susongensis]|uniref:Hook-length control protein FliK n=1 Tax=Paraburkholderia susongensis TaxID=1515439 RepID=A0A1X7KE37_9BURK|nr:flagellar hook-length control protein FliK [Paraburkholderia susongensis]SMG38788.1 hook-length control protein FliK [Paraburkholderia susongensis]